MLHRIGGKDGNVIHIYHHIIQIVEYSVHDLLEMWWCIRGAEWHDIPFIDFAIEDKGGLLAIGRSNWNVPVS